MLLWRCIYLVVMAIFCCVFQARIQMEADHVVELCLVQMNGSSQGSDQGSVPARLACSALQPDSRCTMFNVTTGMCEEQVWQIDASVQAGKGEYNYRGGGDVRGEGLPLYDLIAQTRHRGWYLLAK